MLQRSLFSSSVRQVVKGSSLVTRFTTYHKLVVQASYQLNKEYQDTQGVINLLRNLICVLI